jgi:hypothetical protein
VKIRTTPYFHLFFSNAPNKGDLTVAEDNTMAVSRLTKGLSTCTQQEPLADFGMPDPTKWIVDFDDFTGPIVYPLATTGLAAASTASWTVSVTEAGGGNAASAVADISGGGIQLTTDAADNDTIFSQKANECFLPVAGKKSFFKARFKITDASANAASINECEWYFGLMIRDTDPLSSTAGDGVTDGIFFMSEDGTQNIYLHCQKDATTGQLSTALTGQTLTVATLTEFAWYYDGVQTINVFKDGTQITSIDLTSTPSTYLPNTELTLSFGIKNGEAVAKVMTVDYLFAAQER